MIPSFLWVVLDEGLCTSAWAVGGDLAFWMLLSTQNQWGRDLLLLPCLLLLSSVLSELRAWEPISVISALRDRPTTPEQCRSFSSTRVTANNQSTTHSYIHTHTHNRREQDWSNWDDSLIALIARGAQRKGSVLQLTGTSDVPPQLSACPLVPRFSGSSSYCAYVSFRSLGRASFAFFTTVLGREKMISIFI